jgi:regulator of sirC expression with transglutaminase-like and TPR domain
MCRWIDLPLFAMGAALAFAIGNGNAATPSLAAKHPDSPTALISPVVDPNLDVVRSLLQQPEDQIDLARAKLTIDRMVDPTIDIETNLAAINGMAATENRIIPPGTTVFMKMQTLRQFLYQPGPWNNNTAFQYDFDDPQGRKIENHLLSHYLETHKGQCVSMPILFLVLAQRIGLDASLALAPNHELVMLRGDDGQWMYLETTGTGAPTKLETYRRQMPLPQALLDQGIYMRPLTKKEAVASMVEEVLGLYDTTGRHEQLIAMADLLLSYFPKNVGFLLFESYAYEDIVRRDFMAKYPTSRDIPPPLLPRFNALSDKAIKFRQQAVALGAVHETPQDQEAYADKLARAKTQMANGGNP